MKMRYSMVLCMMLAAGCAVQRGYRAKGLDLATLGPVAVIPFENLSGHPRAGAIVAEHFVMELYTLKRVDLIPHDVLLKRLKPMEGKAMDFAEVARALGARSIVWGTVTEYMYKRSLGEEPVIGVSIRLIDPRTGRALWKGSRSQSGRYSWIREDSLSRLSQEVCRHLAKSMVEQGEP